MDQILRSERSQGQDEWDGASDAQRRTAWGTITQSLNNNPKLSAKVDNVDLGKVELLIRSIREQYYRTTVASKSALRDELMAARLEDHDSINEYITYVETLIKRLTGLGKTIDDEDKQYYLLKGLPDDYDPVKMSISTSEDPLAWERIVFKLRDFASNPKVMGTTASKGKRKKQVYHTQFKHNNKHDKHGNNKGNKQRPPACRLFLKGKCTRSNCKYSHVQLPNTNNTSDKKCSYCGKANHTADVCFKKKRDEEAQERLQAHSIEAQQVRQPAQAPQTQQQGPTTTTFASGNDDDATYFSVYATRATTSRTCYTCGKKRKPADPCVSCKRPKEQTDSATALLLLLRRALLLLLLLLLLLRQALLPLLLQLLLLRQVLFLLLPQPP